MLQLVPGSSLWTLKKKKKSEKMHQSMYNVSAKNDAQQEKEKEQKKPLVTETNKPLYLIQQIM